MEVCSLVLAYVLARLEAGRDREVLGKIKVIDGVRRARPTYGTYDLIVEVSFESIKELDQFLFDKLRKLPHVKETVTVICSELSFDEKTKYEYSLCSLCKHCDQLVGDRRVSKYGIVYHVLEEYCDMGKDPQRATVMDDSIVCDGFESGDPQTFRLVRGKLVKLTG